MAEYGALNDGDQGWVLTSAALVQVMTPGLAFFYGGLASEAAVVSTMMMSYGTMGVVTLLWSLIGYSLAFGKTTPSNVIGSDALATLKYEDTPRWWSGATIADDDPNHAGMPALTTISENAYMSFQLMFAIITAALISGSVVGKMKYWWWLAFVALWHILVYCVLAHWVFYFEGWLWKHGAIDFAGGLVVHIASGVSGFTLAFWLDYGRPKKPRKAMDPHNIPYVLLGAALLWFGWFGFNAGSELASDTLAGRIAANTQISAATGLFTWGLMETIFSGEKGYFTGRPTAVGAASGAIVGLVGITPACGFVSPMWSIFIGLVTAMSVFGAPKLFKATGVDDTLDACAFHGVGGTVGSILTGLVAYNPDNMALTGAFYGDGGVLLGKQIVGVLVTILYCVIWTTIIYWTLYAVAFYVFKTDLRLSAEEQMAPDQSVHGEKAYISKEGTHVVKLNSSSNASPTKELPQPGLTVRAIVPMDASSSSPDTEPAV